ncbi:cell division protein FtsZ [bacterium]|nr:cell division protein FtsZ [bacterium]
MVATANKQKKIDNFIKPYETVIKVIGSGGAGNNAIVNLMKDKKREFETIAINTDAQNLSGIPADSKILIGKNVTAGLGAGGDPQIGERSAEESKEEILLRINDADLLFLTCGLGGGTGTGSLPVISRLAREKGILTLAIVTMPFSEEGIIRWENAQIGLEKLKKNVDCIIVLKNDKLLEIYPDLPILDAFKTGDDILISTIESLATIITQKGLINLDFADLSMIMRDGPVSVIGIGESRSENRAEEAVKRALSHPLMEWNIKNAQNAMIHISGGADMTLRESRDIIKKITKELDPSARIIWGASIDKNQSQKIKVTIVATGLPDDVETIERINGENVNIKKDVESDAIFSTNSLLDNDDDTDESIFDIKESIAGPGEYTSSVSELQETSVKNVSQTSKIFYQIFQNDSERDMKRFERAIHFLRKNPENRKSLMDAIQSCKLIYSNAELFGFDEICELLDSIKTILVQIKRSEKQMSQRILDSVTLAMEMVSDLSENQNDGHGETGYIVDRLKELAENG